MINELAFSDTFAEWKDKINALVANHNIVSDLTLGVTGPFTYNRIASTGLNVSIYGGNVRNGSVVEFLPDTVVALPASSTRVLCIYKVDDLAPVLQLFAVNLVPEKNILPIGIFTTNATTLTGYTDLRTEFIMSSGASAVASVLGLLQFDKNIEVSVTVPSTKNALSIDPIVNEGVTVTIDDGAIWVVL